MLIWGSKSWKRSAIAVVSAVALAAAAWLIHGYYYDASFMEVPAGDSGLILNRCTTGETQYYGYEFTPTRNVHLTSAELVGVPDSFTVVGIYAVSLKQSKQAALAGGTQQDWDQMGYSKTYLYPVSAVNLPAGGMGGWWLVAKVVPHKPGKQTIQGIRVYYTSGSRSGSTVYNEQAVSDCPK